MLIKILLVCCFFNLVMAGELTLCEYSSVVEGCKNKQITKVEIPADVTYIADMAFSGCKWLSVASFPESLQRIGYKAFFEIGLEKLLITGNLTKLGDRSFEGCTKLKEVVIVSELLAIPNDCFKGCLQLKEVGLPMSLKSIGSNAFEECSSLKEIVLPNLLERIGYVSCAAIS